MLTRPPGHHACSGKRVGFCHRNFAIDALKTAFDIGKNALILDIDAHHGDGTEKEILSLGYGHYCSLHAFGPNIYPGTGFTSSERCLNIPLAPSTGDSEWMIALDGAASWIKKQVPDLIILSCGFDAHAEDSLVPLKITEQSFKYCSKMLKDFGVPIVSILEGGYQLDVLGPCVSAVLSAFL
jgi:acetoin utilization deacetylase AcuC-like enzyme